MDQNIQNYLQNQQQKVQPPTMPPLQQPMQAAMGGMGGAANLGQMAQGQFSDIHNQMYEKLRNVLMQLHQSGMPGIDKVLNTLNQQHVSQMKSPAMPISALTAGMTMPVTFPQMGQSSLQPLAESIGTPSLPGSLGAMQEAMQTSRGFPLLAKLDQVIRSGDKNSIQDVTKAIMSDPKYKEYWKSLPGYSSAGSSVTLDTLLPLLGNINTLKQIMQPRMPQQVTRS